MLLDDVVSRLNLTDCRAPLAEGWDAAMATRPERIDFLREGFVREMCGITKLPDEWTALAVAAAARTRDNEALQALAWYMHVRLFVDPAPKEAPREWPNVLDTLGAELAGWFNTIALLSGTPRLLAFYRERGVPEDVATATMLDLRLNLDSEGYIRDHGHPGLSARFLGWLINHWRGDLYRLGRLQFIPGAFREGILRAFRHNTTGRLVALAEDGQTYRADGQIDGAGDVFDGPNAWRSTLRIDDERIVGHPVDPTGFVHRRTVTLPRAEWTQALAAGDPMLDMHIPKGEPMTHQACGESLRQALEFFPRHFPDRPFKGFMCRSWLLDNQFEALLKPTSNLVLFQRDVHLFPILASGVPFTTIYGVPQDTPVEKLPRETSMQRAFAEHMENGGHFRAGGCFLLKEDLDWGSEVYRRQEPGVLEN